ncbi:Rieske (2Fe-2S) domain-containing protein [Salinarchaeum sp. Harcht-Bsk1]|uniref:Rieske (2Fe-2S) protein n=1 Tax=Salinarchaeum sp. Harcht-Bsk1 TaxID=1333523 RepID=UPI00034238BC|nr:Rieske (2Fe-2S) protein [Salinarchaeum sp. Harcht-Bsk1]AGN01274.1 Rieske (2Fe-2S) domain-containing protein [Salinarchaeum sp. Harcht-Bsk1]
MAADDSAPAPEGYVEATDLQTLQDDGAAVAAADGTPIALFYHDGEVHAVDNACPHMGFPLIEGSVDDGILTCHWHHARFELSCGDTFDPWADDVASYPTRIEDGRVYVRPEPATDRPPEERWRDRLDTGLEENLRLVIAKSVIGLDAAGVPDEEPLERGLEFGATYRESGWSSGLTILAAMGNVLPTLTGHDHRRALYTGLRHVASDCSGEPPNFSQPAFDADVEPDRLVRWFRDAVEVRDRDGVERCLRTAVEQSSTGPHSQAPEDAVESEEHGRETIERMLFGAATDHLYLDSGHSLDMINKAIEALDRTQWANAEPILASLVPRLTEATRMEERSQWRQPVDVAGMCFDAFDELEEAAAQGANLRAERRNAADESNGWRWTPDDQFRETLLSDDPQAIVDALLAGVRDGAAPSDLAAPVVDAAATRVAQFGTSNEFNDWNTVHHTFTYANAVREAALRTEADALYRGVFDTAISVYLDRFLNSPPATIPEPDGDGDPESLREDLLDAMDREGAVNEAGRAAVEWLAVADGPEAVWTTLGETLLREDAGFHTLQNYEAGWRQFHRAASGSERRRALVAVARYQAAHFPTRREAEQTFSIATRLHRGEKLHE